MGYMFTAFEQVYCQLQQTLMSAFHMAKIK